MGAHRGTILQILQAELFMASPTMVSDALELSWRGLFLGLSDIFGDVEVIDDMAKVEFIYLFLDLSWISWKAEIDLMLDQSLARQVFIISQLAIHTTLQLKLQSIYFSY